MSLNHVSIFEVSQDQKGSIANKIVPLLLTLNFKQENFDGKNQLLI